LSFAQVQIVCVHTVRTGRVIFVRVKNQNDMIMLCYNAAAFKSTASWFGKISVKEWQLCHGEICGQSVETANGIFYVQPLKSTEQ
jgi:hypothetical protein